MNEPARLHLVSIIVAVRNAQTTLERTLVSALSQTYPNKEIVLIDGASTDGTMEIVKKYSDRLAVIISERDRGIADAYNKGIARSSGEWVYFLNADDVFMDERVLEDVLTSRVGSDDDVIVGRVVADNGRVFDGKYSWRLLMKNMVHHQAIFYRGTLLRSLRYNDAYRRYGHDHEHNLRLWKMKARVAYIDRTIALWNSGGISDNANWEDYKEEFKVRRNVVGGSALLWDVFTLARFVFKRTSLRFKRFRHRALAPQ